MTIDFNNSYALLPDRFFHRQNAARVPAPELVRLNKPLANSLGVDAAYLASADGLAVLSGNATPKGAEPLAQVYGGHQFGHWSPQLGDGRALLLGEVVSPKGERFDFQLKGSGRTPYSRSGDGKATIGAVLREYIVSEAMAALGIPTTRALAVVTTGETIAREAALPGAVLSRVAASHIRVGTFQYFYARGDVDALRALADHVIDRHYPSARAAENPILEMLSQVIERQAQLIAKWMQVGFIHGVMNTDNMSVAGETIDFGPCAFMDAYHPNTVFSSIDENGRYAWGSQPQIGHWNLVQLAQALVPLIGPDEEVATTSAKAALEVFPNTFSGAFFDGFAKKIGLKSVSEETQQLLNDMLKLVADHGVDFTLFFRRLAQGLASQDFREVSALFSSPDNFVTWQSRWQVELGAGDRAAQVSRMQAANPIYIARNHRVEQAITAANSGDYDPFHRLVEVLSQPYSEQEGAAEFERPPTEDEQVHVTFCGT